MPDASKTGVTLTPRCAAVVRETVRQQKFRGEWWLKIGGHDGAWTLDITTQYDPADHVRGESQGIQIMFPRQQSHLYRGLVIDYSDSVIGEGIVFHR